MGSPRYCNHCRSAFLLSRLRPLISSLYQGIAGFFFTVLVFSGASSAGFNHVSVIAQISILFEITCSTTSPVLFLIDGVLTLQTFICPSPKFCNDHCAVGACAKICNDLMASNRIMVRRSFRRIWIAGRKNVSEIVPRSSWRYGMWVLGRCLHQIFYDSCGGDSWASFLGWGPVILPHSQWAISTGGVWCVIIFLCVRFWIRLTGCCKLPWQESSNRGLPCSAIGKQVKWHMKLHPKRARICDLCHLHHSFILQSPRINSVWSDMAHMPQLQPSWWRQLWRYKSPQDVSAGNGRCLGDNPWKFRNYVIV